MCLTLGVLTVVVEGRVARSEVADGIPRYLHTFVLACSFFVVILVLSAWLGSACAGFVCEFS